MPCERKHVEAMEAAFWELVYAPESQPKLDAAVDARDAAYAACDESPCVWKLGEFSGDYTPGCAPDTSTAAGGWRFVWSQGFRKSMTYCPHCGREISTLPAAPEGE